MLDMFDIEDSTTSPSALTIDSSQFQPDLVDDLTLARINYQKARLEYVFNFFHWLNIFRCRLIIIIFYHCRKKNAKRICQMIF